MKRVNPRGHPKALAGRPVTREQLEALRERIARALPRNLLERPLNDLLAEAYMMGVADAAALSGRARSAEDGTVEAGPGTNPS